VATHTGAITAGADVTLGTDGFVQAGAVFSATSFTITDSGNLSESSATGFTAGTGSVDFNGGNAITQSLDSGGSAFNNLIHSGVGTLQIINDALTVNGTLSNNAGTFDANGLNLTVSGATNISAGSLKNSGFTGRLSFSGVLNMMSATLDTGSGLAGAVLGAGVTATPSSSNVPTILGRLDLGGANRTFTVNSTALGDELDVDAFISHGGLAKDGPGVLFLLGPNSYTGGTSINAGTLALATDNAIAGSLTLNDGTTLFSRPMASSTLVINNPITFNGSTTINGGSNTDLTLAGPMNLNGTANFISSNTITLNGVMSGPGGLTAVGNGNLNLYITGNNTYSGPTTINGGFLWVTGTIPDSTVIVNSGVLLGNGTVGPLTINAGGAVIPSTIDKFAPGILTTGNLQFSGGGLAINITGKTPGAGYSQLRVNGTVSLGNGVATVQDIDRTSLRFDYGTKFQIIANLGGMPVSGFFSGPPEGTVITDLAGNRLLISYHGGSGNDVVAMSVPRFDIAGRRSVDGLWQFGHSSGSSFSDFFNSSWNPAVTWVDVQTGDFTGSGLQGIVGRVKGTGQWWMSVPDGSGGFTTSLWDTWSAGVTWVDVKVGDFNSDAKMDIVGRAKETGQWWIAQSTGSSFTNSLWATWNPAATWVDVQVGDFNGDGKTDITGRYLQGGTWWTGISNGLAFSTTQWAFWNTAATWVDVHVGDFNGDGKADIVGRWLQGGQWWVAQSTGSSFTNSLWVTWNPAATWVDVNVGDFNGDGSSDIIGRVLETGQWWVGLSNQVPLPPGFLHPLPSFATTLWSTWSTGVTWVDVQVGDFSGDGKSDITGRALENGQWWTGQSNGTTFNTSLWATWDPGVTWIDVRSGVFN
jgi:autotransporter-associated beta strand protein